MKFSLLPVLNLSCAQSKINLVALAVGLIFCSTPVSASAQSVSFTGAQSVLLSNGLSSPLRLAVDKQGDLFVSDSFNKRVLKLPKTATGYGPQVTLPTSGLHDPIGIAVDGSGDVFIADLDDNRVVELPKTANGYGPQITLPASGLSSPWGVGADSAGNVFIVDTGNARILELLRTETGFDPQITLDTDIEGPLAIAIDGSNNVFILDGGNNRIVELPRTSAGYGAQVDVPFTGLQSPYGLAVNENGNVFVANTFSFPNPRILQLPRKAGAFGAQTTVPTSGVNEPWGLAADGGGNVFVTDRQKQELIRVQTQSVDFGSANICPSGQNTPIPCSATLKLTFKVNAESTLGTPQVLTGGAQDLDFTLAGGSTCEGAIARGKNCIVNVTFAPLTAGTRTGTVEVVDSAGTVLAAASVSGLGVSAANAPPVARVSANTMAFGTVAFASTRTLPLSVTNIGGQTLNITPAFNAGSFTVTASTCAVGLSSGESCRLDVQFSPVSITTFRSLLTLQTNGATNPIVNLTGLGSGLKISGAPLQFGSVAKGSSVVQTLTITNHEVPGLVTLKALTDGPSYQVLNTAENTCLAGIKSGWSCNLPVQFSPTSLGDHNGRLTIVPSAGAATDSVGLHGIAAGIVADNKVLRFGDTALGTSKVLPVTITNEGLPGTVKLGMTAYGASYRVSTAEPNTCLSGIASGQSCTLFLVFAPATPGDHNGSLTLTASGGGAPYKVELTGAGSAGH